MTRPTFALSRMFPPRCSYAAEYFADLARSTQTEAEMGALLGLAIASATVANVRRVHGHGDHYEPAQLWALVISEPGTRKSAVLSELLAPITGWEADQARELGPVVAGARQRRAVDERRLARLTDKAAREEDPIERSRLEGEACELAQRLHAEPIPALPVLLASEPTPEALTRQMAENSGRALLASAEGDALDIMQGRYSGVRNYGAMLKGHAGDPVRAGRVGRDSDIIQRPALAVALCIQPASVEALWNDPQASGRGLLARFALIAPDDRLGSREIRPDPIDPANREAWRGALTRLLDHEPARDDEEPRTITLSTEADRVYLSFQTRTEHALGSGGDHADRRAWGSKGCGLALRIALVLHALADGGRGLDSGMIDTETMRAAIAWVDYLGGAERHARALILTADETRERDRVEAWVRGRGGEATVTDLSASGPQDYRGDREGAERALDDLVGAGRGEWFQPPQDGPGRPRAKVFRLRPGGLEMKPPLAARNPGFHIQSNGAAPGITASTPDAGTADADRTPSPGERSR